MIEGVFDKEKKQMGIVANGHAVIHNISYRLKNDLNAQSFFSSLTKNIIEYEELHHIEQYRFKRDIKEMQGILHLLYRSLSSLPRVKDKSAKEITECCKTFPDYTGRHIISLFSYLPVIDLFCEKLSYEEYISKRIDLDKKYMGQTCMERQHEELFGESVFNRKFPKDDAFTDYALKNRFIDKLEAEYHDHRKGEIEEEINILLPLFLPDEDEHEMKNARVAIGSAYWDNRRNSLSSQAKALGEALRAIVSADKQKEKGEEQ